MLYIGIEERSHTIEALELALKSVEILETKKAEDIVILDVREVSSVADYFVIATGTSAPHIKALAEETELQLKKREGLRCFRKAGTPQSEWMILDYIHVVVHVFSPTTREYYCLERCWNDAPRLSNSNSS